MALTDLRCMLAAASVRRTDASCAQGDIRPSADALKELAEIRHSRSQLRRRRLSACRYHKWLQQWLVVVAGTCDPACDAILRAGGHAPTAEEVTAVAEALQCNGHGMLGVHLHAAGVLPAQGQHCHYAPVAKLRDDVALHILQAPDECGGLSGGRVAAAEHWVGRRLQHSGLQLAASARGGRQGPLLAAAAAAAERRTEASGGPQRPGQRLLAGQREGAVGASQRIEHHRVTQAQAAMPPPALPRPVSHRRHG
mmetsp:Transcript_93681/g.291657  ORF Transcript_93681/g.291657 Transcript_93681/m.291657 type:complete len:253 (-) Transcript_93681:10-768(-)